MPNNCEAQVRVLINSKLLIRIRFFVYVVLVETNGISNDSHEIMEVIKMNSQWINNIIETKYLPMSIID